jgi:nitroreductase
VHDVEVRKKLAAIASNQQHIVTCPAFFAVCADQNRVAHAMTLHDSTYSAGGLEGGLVASIDAALVGLTMSYVAESFGLSSVMIGAMRNNAVEVARLLNLPPRCYVVFGLCVGWAVQPPLPKPRHGLASVLHHDAYNPQAHHEAIVDYDRELAAYYRKRGVETPDAAWSLVMSQKYQAPKRTKLREELRQLGFPLEGTAAGRQVDGGFHEHCIRDVGLSGIFRS